MCLSVIIICVCLSVIHTNLGIDLAEATAIFGVDKHELVFTIYNASGA